MARTKPTKLKSNGKYVDAPRFKAIYGYEDEFKKAWSGMMQICLLEVAKKIGK